MSWEAKIKVIDLCVPAEDPLGFDCLRFVRLIDGLGSGGAASVVVILAGPSDCLDDFRLGVGVVDRVLIAESFKTPNVALLDILIGLGGGTDAGKGSSLGPTAEI
jgi:hypothetical protein